MVDIADTVEVHDVTNDRRGASDRSRPSRESRARRLRRSSGRTAVRIASVAVVIVIWWLVTALHIWSEVIVPPPAKVWDAFVQSVTVHDGQTGLSGYYLWQHLWASLWRVLQGIMWGFVVGVPLGLLIAAVPKFRLVVEPYVNFIRSLPPLAYFSLLIIWFGIDDTSKIWLLFLAAFAPIAISTASGVEAVPKERIDSARALGANRRQVLVHTILPSALPELFTGLRLAIGFAWTTVVAAETSNGIPGIGGLAWSTHKQLRSDIAVLCVIVIGLTAIALDLVVRSAERVLVPWKGKG